MIKVCILAQCEFCDGEAYIFVCEEVDARGETLKLYRIEMIPLFCPVEDC